MTKRIQLNIDTVQRLKALRQTKDEPVDGVITRGLTLVESQGRTKEEQVEYDYWDRDNWDLYMAELKYYRERYGDSYRLSHKENKKPLSIKGFFDE